MSEQNARTALALLKKLEILTSEVTNDITRITIVKYEEYQADTSELTSRLTKVQPRSNQGPTIEEAFKEVKRIKPKSASTEAGSDSQKNIPRELISIFCEEYKKAKRQQYHVSAKDAGQAKLIQAEGFNEEWFRPACVAYLTTNDEWPKKAGWSLAFMLSQINKWANQKREMTAYDREMERETRRLFRELDKGIQ
jgi:hypothetical protein